MTHSCKEFRALLEAALEAVPRESPRDSFGGDGAERSLSELSWHEHLLTCGDCRNLLEAEEALEILLATLPAPKLPEYLARRVVSRLRHARSADSRLDALLELDRAARAPQHLAQSVLAGLESARGRGVERSAAELEAALDRWLDSDRDVAVPRALAQRVLAGLRAERELGGVRSERAAAGQPSTHAHSGMQSRRPWSRSPWPYAAAAGILATWIGWSVWRDAQSMDRNAAQHLVDSQFDGGARHSADTATGQGAAPNDGHKVAKHEGRAPIQHGGDTPGQHGGDAAPDADLLAALDVLEHWDLLRSEDVDVLLSSSIDPADEALLEYQDMDAPAQPPNEKETEPPSKG